MSLVAWYPLNGNYKNNGDSLYDVTNLGTNMIDSGKIRTML